MSEPASSEPEISTPASAIPPAEILYCSFCFKSQHQVKNLVAGYGSIYICDECVSLCNAYIAGRRPRTKPPSFKELPTERLLERLGAIEATLQGKGNQLQESIELLRSRQVSWAVIGAALGISRQSAWERFS